MRYRRFKLRNVRVLSSSPRYTFPAAFCSVLAPISLDFQLSSLTISSTSRTIVPLNRRPGRCLHRGPLREEVGRDSRPLRRRETQPDD